MRIDQGGWARAVAVHLRPAKALLDDLEGSGQNANRFTAKASRSAKLPNIQAQQDESKGGLDHAYNWAEVQSPKLDGIPFMALIPGKKEHSATVAKSIIGREQIMDRLSFFPVNLTSACRPSSIQVCIP